MATVPIQTTPSVELETGQAPLFSATNIEPVRDTGTVQGISNLSRAQKQLAEIAVKLQDEQDDLQAGEAANSYQKESDEKVNQLHFSNVQILGLISVFLVVLCSFLLISADYVSKTLYDKRLREFKANYNAVAVNIDGIQSRLKELDNQILDIEKKDKAVRLYAGMPGKPINLLM